MKKQNVLNGIQTVFIALFMLSASCRSSSNDNTSFAIVIDSVTHAHTHDAVNAYKQMLEREGLHVHLLINQWATPDEIRDTLSALYHQKPVLEGAVFIGDIPIPMIRDAQHLTSAFKMDQERFPYHRSSVPSDRFYDDFNLQFRYLEQDKDNPLLHYYSLTAASAQKISTSIYSGRIKPPVGDGDPYLQIAKYLNKVVVLRDKLNPLNRVLSYSGHGYNSECLVAWADEITVMREQMQHLFLPGSDFQNIYSQMNPSNKFLLLSELQRDDLDVAILSNHGSPTVQYLDGWPNVSAITPSIENVRRFLRSRVRNARARGQDEEQVRRDYFENHGVPAAWFSDAFDPSVTETDSIFEANLNIYVQDVEQIQSNARFIKLDACFNGSFHLDTYIAGSYVFGNGNTVVALANTVNVIQDNRPTEMIGLLAEGVRVGNWARHIHFLENHIIGDPTFYFHSNGSTNWNRKIVLEQKGNKTWLDAMKNPAPDIQSLALSMLHKNRYPEMEQLLEESFNTSLHATVRMHALTLLYEYNGETFYNVLKKAVSDPYEMIRRFAVKMIGETGRADLVPALVSVHFNDLHSKRVLFNARNAVAFMPREALRAAIEQHFTASVLVNKAEMQASFFRLAEGRVLSDLEVVTNPDSEERLRLREIKTLRNYNYHFHVPEYVAVAASRQEPAEVRMTMIEALGWFTHSYNKQLILDMCSAIIKDSSEDELIRLEAQKTMNRLVAFEG